MEKTTQSALSRAQEIYRAFIASQWRLLVYRGLEKDDIGLAKFATTHNGDSLEILFDERSVSWIVLNGEMYVVLPSGKVEAFVEIGA